MILSIKNSRFLNPEDALCFRADFERFTYPVAYHPGNPATA